ncbi:MAG TPA: hypothetical protein VJ343_00145 [archaeon]|nr:hypothetical protein [archaeon]
MDGQPTNGIATRCAICENYLPVDKGNTPDKRVFINGTEICKNCWDKKKHINGK